MRNRARSGSLGVLVVLLAALILPSGTSGAPSAPKRGGTLVISLGTDVPIFDCNLATGIPNLGIILMATETLTRIDPNGGRVLPHLAESWSLSPDGKTWTFKLRRGVRFHDGTPFNAEAVKFSIERLLDPGLRGPARPAFTMIERVSPVDDLTVNLVTEGRFSALPAQLAYAPICMNSPTQVRKLGERYYTAPMGTGPFRFVHHIRGREVRLEANREYWGGAPHLDAVLMRPIPETAARIMALEAGEVDVAYHVPPRDADRLRKNPRFEVLAPPPQRKIFIGMNVLWGPFRDKRVRQALNYAVDKQAIVDRIFLGLARVTDSPVPHTGYGYFPTRTYEYDPAKARRLLAEAGYPRGFEATLHFAPGRYLMDTEVVEAVQAYLAAVGVQMKIIRMEWGAYQAAQRKGPEESTLQMFFIGWGLPTLDADLAVKDYMQESWAPGGLNNMFYARRDLTDLILAQRYFAEPERRLYALKKIQEIIMEDAPQIFLYTEPQIHAKRADVRDFTISVTEMVDLMHRTWLDR
ncbi:MAG: ABC transporter substrate-binding protein [Armatimonadota bacterium]|nr:ABC transporter substrate-binding protein [Armatimonadota bacterium]